MFNSGRVRRNGFADSQLATVRERLRQASAARAEEAAGGAVLYSGDADMTDAQIAALPFEMYRQGYEYYWQTHAHPNSTFKYTTSSLLDLMRWDAVDQIDLIDQPLLMMAGNKVDSLYMTEEAFAKTAGTKDKEIFLIDGATHIETYWVPEYLDAAMGKLMPFFARTLLGTAASRSSEMRPSRCCFSASQPRPHTPSSRSPRRWKSINRVPSSSWATSHPSSRTSPTMFSLATYGSAPASRSATAA